MGSLEQEGAELQFCVSVLTLQNLSSAMTNSHKKNKNRKISHISGSIKQRHSICISQAAIIHFLKKSVLIRDTKEVDAVETTS